MKQDLRHRHCKM